MIFINVVNERLSFDIRFFLLQIDLLETSESVCWLFRCYLFGVFKNWRFIISLLYVLGKSFLFDYRLGKWLSVFLWLFAVFGTETVSHTFWAYSWYPVIVLARYFLVNLFNYVSQFCVLIVCSRFGHVKR